MAKHWDGEQLAGLFTVQPFEGSHGDVSNMNLHPGNKKHVGNI